MRETCAESLCACGAWDGCGWRELAAVPEHDLTPASYLSGWGPGANFTGYAAFWSSSPNANNGNNAWNVNFNNGNDNWNNKNNSFSVRLVRSGAWHE
jgi:hypothetical protein